MSLQQRISGPAENSLSSVELGGQTRGPSTGFGVAPLSTAYVETTDAAASSSTIYSLADGDSFSGTISSGTDVDWIKVTLQDGEYLISKTVSGSLPAYDVTTAISGSPEVYFDIINSNSMYYNTSGGALDVYVQVSSYGGYTGNYTTTVEIFSFETASAEKIADYLVDGWIGQPMHWNVSPGDSISVNISKLTASGQSLALAALEMWTMFTGINFQVTTSTGTGVIDFDDNQSGAFAGPSAIGDGGIISAATVNIGTGWLATYGTNLDDYSFLTYIHEIGHALGLNHGGPYDGFATYQTTSGGDNIFVNDSRLMTVMSYFGLDEVTGDPAGYWLPITPMISDIIAMQTLYGVAGNLRTGDTTYGYGSNAGGAMDSFLTLTDVAMLIMDDGGTDTINLSSLTTANVVDLTPGGFSSVNGNSNNLVIFGTSLIENLILGSGDDIGIGNSVANSINGRDGNDTLVGGEGDDQLIGQNGNDTLVGGEGADTLNGGAGYDAVVYLDSSSAVDIYIANVGGTASGGTAVGDVFINVESAYGTVYDDALRGTSLKNTFYGDDGNDTIILSTNNDAAYGGAGNDVINGGRGADIIDGGDGIDEITYSNSDARVIANLTTGIVTGSGHGSGDVVSNVENVFGSRYNDIITGNVEANVLNGYQGNDTLLGGGGNDSLIGGTGNDTLNGGIGDDTMNGGTGTDVFIFTDAAFGQDVITGWQNGQDTLDFTALGWDETDFTIAASGSDTLLTLISNPTQTLTIVGISAATINGADFV